MSLNWDVSKVSEDVRLVADPDGGEPVMNPVTNALIWATMAVGIGEITEKNVEEFYTRLHVWEIALGPYLSDTDKDGNRKPYLMTPTDVQNHIGLVANVAYESTAKFRAKVMRNLEGIASDRWYAFKREQVAA